MRRRRKPSREIHFSFDSFLDVVANVVGIIIRLILVAWVGARTYQGIQIPGTDEKSLVLNISANKEKVSLESLLEKLSLLQIERDALVRLSQEKNEEKNPDTKVLKGIEDKTLEFQKLQGVVVELTEKEKVVLRDTQKLKLTREQLAARTKKLEDEIALWRNKKGPTQVVKYQTPVSRNLQSEELIFECRNGKVCAVDIGAMMEEISDRMQELGEKLRSRWEVEEVTQPHGPFKLRYTLERERSAIELANPSLPPNDRANFRFALTGWVLEPLDNDRGETLEQALKPDSEFLKIILGLDGEQTAVSFCVYPDSFPVYRRLRDLVHERNIVVAGRPLVKDAPIAMSIRKGTASRGQ